MRAFSAVFNNLMQATAIFAPAFAYSIACFVWLKDSKIVSQDIGTVTRSLSVNIPISSMNFTLFFIFIIGALIYMASVVTWHRFIIMDAKASVSPLILIAPHFGNYVLSALKIILLFGVFSFTLMFFIIPVTVTLFQTPRVIWTLFYFIMSSLWNAVYLIMCLILPAAAVGRYVRVLETFELTDFRTVLGASIIINIAAYFAETVIDWLPFNLLLSALFNAFFVVFQISVLTTLYQHYVEKDFDPKT